MGTIPRERERERKRGRWSCSTWSLFSSFFLSFFLCARCTLYTIPTTVQTIRTTYMGCRIYACADGAHSAATDASPSLPFFPFFFFFFTCAPLFFFFFCPSDGHITRMICINRGQSCLANFDNAHLMRQPARQGLAKVPFSPFCTWRFLNTYILRQRDHRFHQSMVLYFIGTPRCSYCKSSNYYTK